jgi:23S rRNA (cytosine1962-C5)-methyltransferase
MASMADLELLDCGDGRRLERFGTVTADRAAPAAVMPAILPETEWHRAPLAYGRGGWVRGGDHAPWTIRVAGLTLECRPAAGGQVGVFPEHARTWTWLERIVTEIGARLGRPPEILSLFAYTGGATLACARGGGRIAHVDASRPAVGWARRNAELSGLAERPIRWLVDDARAFVRRERRRGRSYDGVVLDPPTYGHGNGAWHLESDLEPRLAEIAALVGPRPALAVLAAHTPGYDGERLAALLREHLGVDAAGDELELVARTGNVLRLGSWARHPGRTRA